MNRATEDLISRTAAKGALVRYADSVDATNVLADWLIQIICDLPTVDAAPVIHGRWILIQNGSGVCSVCNRSDHIDKLAKYCRYCGARMETKNE